MRTKIDRLHPLESLGVHPAKAGEIRVERLEQRLSPRVPFPHKHDFFHFLFLEKGSGWHEIDFERFAVTAGQVFLMRPGQVHSWTLGKSTRGYVLEFTRGSLPKNESNDRLLDGIERTPAMLHPAKDEQLFTIARLMHAEYSTERPGYEPALEHLLATLLIAVERHGAADGVKAPPALVLRFEELVERSYQREHSVEFYARELGSTTKALTTAISRALGKSAGTVIQERCLVEAKRLLAHSELPVAEVGYKIGYDDPNYFARFFRAKTGLAPGRFRRLAGHIIKA